MNSYLETGIALVLIIFVFSIVVYVIQELIAVNLKYRGKMLKDSLEQILNATNIDERLAETFFKHPQIKLLQEKLQKLPSYVPAANFAVAIMDIVSKKNNVKTGNLLNDFKSGLEKFADANGDLPTLFRTWAENSNDIKELKENIEKWYNEYMDRVTGWYKNNHRVTTRIIAVTIAILFNLNIIKIAKTIHNDPVLKAQLLAQAERTVDQPDTVQKYYTTNLDSEIKNTEDKYAKGLDTTADQRKKDSLIADREKVKDVLIKNYNKKQYEVAKALIDSASGGKLVFGWQKWPLELEKVFSKETDWKKYSGEYALMLLGLFIGAVCISIGAPFWFDLLVKLVNVRRAGIKPTVDKTKNI